MSASDAGEDQFVVEHVRLRADSSVLIDHTGVATLVGSSRAVRLGPLGAGVQAVLLGLREGGTEEELAAKARGAESVAALSSWAKTYLALRSGNWLERRLEDGTTTIATLEPIAFASRQKPPNTDAALIALSRFAIVRREGTSFVVESPRARSSVAFHHRAALELLAALDGSMTADALLAGQRSIGDRVARRLLSLLDDAGLLVICDGDGGSEEDRDRSLAQWSTTDLLFHARTRIGRNSAPYGGTYPLKGRFEPLPARKPVRSSTVALPRPSAPSSSLDALFSARSSLRAHDDEAPITTEALAALLYRSSRLGSVTATPYGEVASRPYPSGGSLYELEVYPVVRRCAGLDPGVYRYQGEEHRLEHVAGISVHVERLLELARVTGAMDERPQVLLVITARFGRVMWKYSAIAYALVLKHVGVLYQTLYLVATEMGLAPCALGGGDSDLFGEIAGLCFEEEASVGEFVLGSRRTP